MNSFSKRHILLLCEPVEFDTYLPIRVSSPAGRVIFGYDSINKLIVGNIHIDNMVLTNIAHVVLSDFMGFFFYNSFMINDLCGGRRS